MSEEPGEPGRLCAVGALRLAIGALGLAGFVVGVIVAWHSESATTLLIVSAVLLVLASLGLDRNKVRGSYGGWTVELLRNVSERIDRKAADVARPYVDRPPKRPTRDANLRLGPP